VPHGGAIVRQPFGEAEKAALAGPSGLVAQLAVAKLRDLHETRELLGGDVDVEFLKRQKVLRFHVDLLRRKPKAGRST
jgi:hypothetical protein